MPPDGDPRPESPAPNLDVPSSRVTIDPAAAFASPRLEQRYALASVLWTPPMMTSCWLWWSTLIDGSAVCAPSETNIWSAPVPSIMQRIHPKELYLPRKPLVNAARPVVSFETILNAKDRVPTASDAAAARLHQFAEFTTVWTARSSTPSANDDPTRVASPPDEWSARPPTTSTPSAFPASSSGHRAEASDANDWFPSAAWSTSWSCAAVRARRTAG